MNFARTDERMMARCIQLAKSGAAQGEYPFGSLVALGETVISEGVNHSIREQTLSRPLTFAAIRGRTSKPSVGIGVGREQEEFATYLIFFSYF
jgi:hypothetical protein